MAWRNGIWRKRKKNGVMAAASAASKWRKNRHQALFWHGGENGVMAKETMAAAAAKALNGKRNEK